MFSAFDAADSATLARNIAYVVIPATLISSAIVVMILWIDSKRPNNIENEKSREVEDTQFRVWKNVFSAFSGLVETLSVLRWYLVPAFLLILIQTASGELISLAWPQTIIPPWPSLLGIFFGAVWVLSVAPLGVAVHRQILLSERPKINYFRMFGQEHVHRFARVGFIIYLVGFCILFFLTTPNRYLENVSLIFLGFLGILYLAITTRISVIFPAIATNAQDPRIINAWNDTRGNTLRIWFGSIVLNIPFIVLYLFLFDRVEPEYIPVFAKMFVKFFKIVLVLLHLIVSIRFVSFIFRDRASSLVSTSHHRPTL
jgi:hypothetical protein